MIQGSMLDKWPCERGLRKRHTVHQCAVVLSRERKPTEISSLIASVIHSRMLESGIQITRRLGAFRQRPADCFYHEIWFIFIVKQLRKFGISIEAHRHGTHI